MESEAATVRRIFLLYAGGKSPRDIAALLNAEKVPGPRGGVWNASTIAGSRKRNNGILQNQLYIDRIVWNRQNFRKDPERGTRVSRANAVTARMTADAPALAIVDAGRWEQVQKRRATRAGPRGWTRRPKHLLSGLLKCACCGSGYIVVGRDKRGSVVGCSRARETGLCGNRRTLGLGAIEARVLEGIEQHLGAPELIAAYVRKFHAERARLAAEASGRRRALEKALATCQAEIRRLVEVLQGNRGTLSRAA